MARSVYVRPKLCDEKRHSVRHEPGNEVNVAAQAVELRYADSTAMAARFCERSGELWAAVECVSAFACLDFHELTDDLEALRRRKTRKRLALCLKAKARTPDCGKPTLMLSGWRSRPGWSSPNRRSNY